MYFFADFHVALTIYTLSVFKEIFRISVFLHYMNEMTISANPFLKCIILPLLKALLAPRNKR